MEQQVAILQRTWNLALVLQIVEKISENYCPWLYISPRLWNTGLVSSGASLTSWGEGATLALVGHPSSDGVTIKMPYGVDVLHQPALHPISWEMNAGGSCD